MAPKNRNTNTSESDSDSGPTVIKKRSHDKATDEYRQKRTRNNVAVRKSREKSRAKAKETMEKVNRLKRENEDLEMKVTLLSKELSLLKDLFLSHAGSDSKTATILVPKSEKTETYFMDSTGETDNSIDSMDAGLDIYGIGAGTPANAEAVQRDHEYSAPCRVRVK